MESIDHSFDSMMHYVTSYALYFGTTCEFKQESHDGFMEAYLHLVNRDFDALANDFVTLGY